MITINSKFEVTILLVEEDSLAAKEISRFLLDRGYKVIIATSGVDAREKTRDHVDLIILDIVLSDIEGLELCHYFKKSKETFSIPIIALSRKSYREDERVRCFNLGADDFVNYPFSSDDLFVRVDPLLNRSSSNRDTYLFNRSERLRELRLILGNKLIEPYFQPIYRLEPFEILGLEMLSRPKIEGRLNNPELLFSAALEFDCYMELEMIGWQKALDLFNLQGEGHALFLNCNPRLVENDNLKYIENLFQQSSFDINNVFLELTERSAILKRDLFYERLKEYRGLGFKFALDDLGGGYSSIESMVETHAEVVKIDRHIVTNIDGDQYKKSIVKFIVSFCHEHDIICVAEGVETKNEYQILKNIGVDACQGFYFYRPTPQLDIPAFRAITF